MTPCTDGTRAHHWLFETPNGPTVRGECQRCGAVQVCPTHGEGPIAPVPRGISNAIGRPPGPGRHQAKAEGPGPTHSAAGVCRPKRKREAEHGAV